jgi:hypothetical protein
MSAPLKRYQTEFSDIPGFFQFESMVLWDFFFIAQDRFGVHGDSLEIGVYKGKSAVLGALYMRPEERAIFVDVNLMNEARTLIQGAKPHNNIFLERRSCDLLSDPALRNLSGGFRWCHIDGDHTGYSTAQDIYTASYLIGERGIICVDDFFNFRYPQLTAAVYQFLSDNRLRFRMLFCGANKCYLCRTPAYTAYEDEIRKNLAKQVRTYDLKLQIYKTSYSYDNGCFSLWLGDLQRAVYGLDDDPDVVPF